MPVQVSQSSAELLRERTEQLRQSLRKARRGQVAGVHKARVATRRLRELLPLLGLEGDRAKRLLRRLSRSAKRLGRVRDLDVQLHQIDLLIRAEPDDTALPRLRGELRDKVERRRKRLVSKKTVATLERVVERLDRSADPAAAKRLHGGRELRWAVQARIVRRSADLRRAISGAGSLYEPERLHGVRVAVKKLRYTLEIAGTVLEGQYSDELRLLASVQQILGRQHDAQVLLDSLAAADGDGASTDASPCSAATEAALDGRCRRLHGRFLRSRQDLLDLCSRLGAGGASVATRQSRRAS